jgi:hypothetical protein
MGELVHWVREDEAGVVVFGVFAVGVAEVVFCFLKTRVSEIVEVKREDMSLTRGKSSGEEGRATGATAPMSSRFENMMVLVREGATCGDTWRLWNQMKRPR